MTKFIEHFGAIPDSRVERTRLHKLIDILFITMTALLCGCDEWEEIELFAKKKEPWLRKYLELPNGIPSHDTINRVVSTLDPSVMRQKFIGWVKEVAALSEGSVVSMDGKRLCGSGKDGKEAIVHMVSAWGEANNMVLGCYKVEDKSNEIVAIPKLLELLDLTGCIITIDAMGCQKEIAEKIIEQKAHYILAVKDNQPRLLDDIKEAFSHEHKQNIQEATQTNKGHGRIEKRTCRVITDMDWICQNKDWKQLKSIIEITAQRTNLKTGVQEQYTRYYISDMVQQAADFNGQIRSPLGIENKQHWQLDVTFGEDQSRKRAGNAAENFGLLTRMALNTLKQDTTVKASMKRKRKLAGWDEHYLEQLLQNMKI